MDKTVEKKMNETNVYHRPRILKSIKSVDDAKHYARNRCTQLLKFGWKTISFETFRNEDNAIVSIIVYLKHIRNNDNGQFIILLDQYVGKDLYSHTYDNSHQYVTLTFDDCNMEQYFDKHNIKYNCYYHDYGYYKYIDDYYGDRKSTRSDVYYMNHIDEGLGLIYFLNIKNNNIVYNIYAMHPVVQGDNELKEFFTNYKEKPTYNYALIGAMEYRNIANQYLSHRKINHIDEIQLSPLESVNNALMIDKIQNYKDFLLYHSDTHPRSNELSIYFKNWLDKFGISDDVFKNCIEFIGSPGNVFWGVANTIYEKGNNEMNDSQNKQQILPRNLLLIQGSSGSGKTTTLNEIMNNDNHRKIFANDYGERSLHYRARDIHINLFGVMDEDVKCIKDTLRGCTFDHLYLDFDFITLKTLIDIANHYKNVKIFATLNHKYN